MRRAQDEGIVVSVLIDSRDRDYDKYPKPNSYVVDLPETFRNVSAARLVTAELPSSFYVFTAARGNTTLTVAVNGVSKNVVIPDGNYAFPSMTKAIETAIKTAFSISTCTCTIDPVTLKCTLACGASVVAVDTTSVSSSVKAQWGLAYYLGFQSGVVLTGTGGVTGPRIATMNPESYILVDIDQLGTLCEPGMYGTGGRMGKTFAKIPLSVASFDYIIFDKAITSNAITPVLPKLNSLRVSFRFHDGTPVDFQYVEHSLTLELAVERLR